LDPAKVIPSSQVELPNAVRRRTEKEIAPQGLKRLRKKAISRRAAALSG
jgi:hypothetical protein